MRPAIPAIVGGLLLVSASAAPAQTLRGSRVAMERQHAIAREHDYTFLSSPQQVRQFAERGLLVRVSGNSHLQLVGVSHPYARPALKTFVERLGQQYHAACGEALVVTSLTRPRAEQPHNAHDLSVHPTGMAVDLRISNRGSCQRWLARTLLELEERGVLDATRENRPPHFHVALFPDKYLAYLGKTRDERPVVRVVNAPPARTAPAGEAVEAEPSALGQSVAAVEKYRVNRGDTLWTIARRYGTTVEQIRELNNLRGSRIAAGQVIAVPLAATSP